MRLILKVESTGHHGFWVIPKLAIKSRAHNSSPGLIPDYLIGGKSSDGFTWHVIELKGANERIFNKRNNKLALSNIANEGFCQLTNYIDFCSKTQTNLRENFQLTDFREPKGTLIIGRSKELEDDKQKQGLKSAINRYGSYIKIRTYDSLIREMACFLY